MEEDHRATMTLLSEMGYKYKEVAGFKHLIVEYDKPQPENELECAPSSINYLKSLKF